MASDPAAWTKDYRCPDVVVFLNETSATRYDAFWHGGPDLAIEIVSAGDESRTKIGFYAKVGTRELLLVDRDPWRLKLYRHDGSGMPLAASADLSGGEVSSTVIPLTLSLEEGAERPEVVAKTELLDRDWRI